MSTDLLEQSFASLLRYGAEEFELGVPRPMDQSFDDYESPTLVHAALQEFDSQRLLSGDAEAIDQFLQIARTMASPKVIAWWLRESTFFANDAGLAMQRLARTWRNDTDPIKRYVADRAEFLVDPSSMP